MPKNDTEKDNTNTGLNKPPKSEKPTPSFPLFSNQNRQLAKRSKAVCGILDPGMVPMQPSKSTRRNT